MDKGRRVGSGDPDYRPQTTDLGPETIDHGPQAAESPALGPDVPQSAVCGLRSKVSLEGSEVSPSDGLRKDEFWALRDVSFDLRPGDVLGLVGSNGAGKTMRLEPMKPLPIDLLVARYLRSLATRACQFNREGVAYAACA